MMMINTSPIWTSHNNSLPRWSQGEGLLRSRHCRGKLQQFFIYRLFLYFFKGCFYTYGFKILWILELFTGTCTFPCWKTATIPCNFLYFCIQDYLELFQIFNATFGFKIIFITEALLLLLVRCHSCMRQCLCKDF